MKKILALDIGDKRIGVAVSDKKLITTYSVVDNSNMQNAITEINKICLQQQITEIVIGIPKSHNAFQMDKIHTFARELTKNLNIEINFIDETLTSKEAERILQNQRIDRKSLKYKEEIDKISAKLILEQFLNKND